MNAPTTISNRHDHRQGGLTLLEVLVALVVFSIGLLGLATLQLTGVKHAYNSHTRTVALAQAQSMLDLMRANPAGVAAGAYDTTDDGMPTTGTTLPADCSDKTVECTPEQLALYHLKNWAFGPGPTYNADGQGLESLLPNGVGAVCLDSTPTTADWSCDGLGTVYAIKVRWRERDIGEGDRAVGDTSDDGFRKPTLILRSEF